jgi:hypothetical protein
MKTFFTSTLLVVCGFLTAGCVTHTTIKDESRQEMRFNSAEAAQMFYDAYLSAGRPKGNGSVILSIPIPYHHRTVETDNVKFNAAAQRADEDLDGAISDEEATLFAAQVQMGR